MAQSKDPAIKLFGRKIPVPDTQMPASPLSEGSQGEGVKVEIVCPREDCSEEQNKSTASMEGKDGSQPNVKLSERQAAAEVDKNQPENESSDQEKVLKKPDKIIPCPRCNSLETKFCYFNNYNVNQPRHFCKNCQRYWTAGGTMRNVPVGAGRRKNKHLPSQYRQILVSSDGVPMTRVENSDSAGQQLVSATDSSSSLSASTGTGVVLKFGPEAPLCQSMETVLNLRDHKRYVDASSVGPRENVEEPSSSGSAMTASSNRANEVPEDTKQKENVNLLKSSDDHASPHLLQLHSLTPLVFPWNPAWSNSAAVAASKCSPAQTPNLNGNNPSQAQWCPAPVLAVPGFCPPNIPLQFIPASYWGCMPVWAPGAGSISIGGSNGCLSPSSSTSTSCCSGNGSPNLGKHSRDSNLSEDEKSEKSLFAPKTLRIDDSNEASKGPLWAALGLKSDCKDAMPKEGNSMNVETKGQGKSHVSDGTLMLGAKPAAFSCSGRWQERT